MTIRPMTGEKLAEVINNMLNAPADMRERMKVALQPKAGSTLDTAPAKP